MVAGGYATRGTVTCADARRLGVTPRWSSALAKAVYKTNQQAAPVLLFYILFLPPLYKYSRRSDSVILLFFLPFSFSVL